MRNLSATVNSKPFLKSLSVYAAKFDKGCLLIDDIPKELVTFIKETGKGIGKGLLGEFGVEKEIHITILYGLEASANEIKEFFTKPIKLKTRDRIEYFDNGEKEGTVALIRLDSDDLDDLHKKLKSEFKNDHRKGPYKPHLTIAYLKPGCRLPDEKIETFSWEVDKIVLSDAKNKRKNISISSG